MPRDEVVWLLAGAAIAAVVAYVVYSFVGAIVVGIFLYYAVRPVERWLDSRVDHPDVTASVALLVMGGPMLLVLGYGALVAVRELHQLLTQSGLGQYEAMLQPYLNVASLTDPGTWTQFAEHNVGLISTYAAATFTWGVRLFVMVLVAFYLLRDDRKLGEWFRSTFEGVNGVVSFMEGVDADLTTIYTGNLITIGVTGLIAAVTYYGLDLVAPAGTGVAFPILLGLVTGVMTLLPVLGMKIVYVPYVGYLLVRSLQGPVPLWYPIAFFAVVFVVVDTVPDLFIRSYISKGDLHMGLMVLAYVLGSIAFGWYGIFLGPIVLVVAIHFAKSILPHLVHDRHVYVDSDVD